MMKKLLLILFLGSLLVAVSYYKTTLQDEKVTDAYDSGRTEASEDIQKSQLLVDSLKDQLSANETKLSQSENLADTIRLCQNDSLKEVVAQKELAIAGLTSQSQTIIAQKKTKSDSSKAQRKHIEILAHYEKLYKNLPTDLTAYERRVALAEIRDLSARKFSISVEELNRIRKVAQLDY